MKMIALKNLTVLFVLALGAGTAFADEQMGAPVSHSREFMTMKELVGVWEGQSDMGKGLEPVKVVYELTSGGNAVVERFAAGMPHEMVTIYYDFNGKLNLTHYCSLGNQPRMELANSRENTIVFVLSKKAPGLVSLQEMHMHAHSLARDEKDSITQTWTLYDKGSKKGESVVKLTRTKM